MRLGKDQPQEQVGHQSGYTAGDQGDQEGQPEPENADPKELGQAAAHTGDDAVIPGAAQGIALGGDCHGLFSVSRFTCIYGEWGGGL
jgi:hypothetical protein